MSDQIKKTAKIFKDAFEALSDFFEEKRSDTIEEKINDSKVALAKFSKSLIGNTDKINFRILIGQKKEFGDVIYEAVYLSDTKSPKIFINKVEEGRSVKNILSNFKDDDWSGYKKSKKFKDLDKFLEYVYKEGVYVDEKKKKKEDALNILIKGLKRALEAVESDENEKSGGMSPRSKKIAKIIAVTAVTTIASAVLTPAVSVVAQEIATGGQITGGVLNQAGQAALEGARSIVDPVKLAKKAVQKTVTKGADLGGD
ncbi:MAG: hypothetical protein ACFFBP_06420 [Promethearchaeota archaeon]